jgi:hypothetical protein
MISARLQTLTAIVFYENQIIPHSRIVCLPWAII